MMCAITTSMGDMPGQDFPRRWQSFERILASHALSHNKIPPVMLGPTGSNTVARRIATSASLRYTRSDAYLSRSGAGHQNTLDPSMTMYSLVS